MNPEILIGYQINPEFLIGQQSVCFCLLLIMAVSIFFDKPREKALDLLFSASVLMMCATALNAASMMHSADSQGVWIRVYGRLSVLLGVVPCIEMLAFFSLWKPEKGIRNRITAILSAMIPIGAACAVWMLTRETALFFIGESLSLLAAWAFYQQNVQEDLRRQAKEIESQQAMLFQWQMQPHFLFNTMSSIRELMASDPALAAAGLDNLAGYLRKNLDALTQNQMILFEQELAHIEQYVMLEKMNPANLFEVVYDLQVIDFSLPALTVQPLVENAIRHGVRSLGSEGMVFVTTELHGDMIRIIVEDNGHGFTNDITEQQRARTGYGLENVRKRLETQCGGSLNICSEEQGTRLVVLIPKEGMVS